MMSVSGVLTVRRVGPCAKPARARPRGACNARSGSANAEVTATPEDQSKAMELDAYPLAKASLQLVTLQMLLGYVLSPAVTDLLDSAPQVALGAGPLLSQLLLIQACRLSLGRVFEESGKSRAKYFQYIVKPGQTVVAALTTVACFGGTVLLAQMDSSPEASRTAADVTVALTTGQPLNMLGMGLASACLSPWIEERIHRGIVLQSLEPKIGGPAAVLVSSGTFAASHLTSQGFLQLFLFGCVLGTSHLASKKNLWVPTMVHSLYNMIVFLLLLLTTRA